MHLRRASDGIGDPVPIGDQVLFTSPIIKSMELRNDKNKASFPRTKKFLPSLALLLTNRIEQPETRIANKLFPNRPFAQRLSHNHQRLKSSLAICGRRQQKKNEVAEYRVLDDLQDKRTE